MAPPSGPMHIYDTARREVIAFEPGPVVLMYTCGITPYDATHLGHAATYVTYDVLQRRLRDLGHETRCVRNVTDVDDGAERQLRLDRLRGARIVEGTVQPSSPTSGGRIR